MSISQLPEALARSEPSQIFGNMELQAEGMGLLICAARYNHRPVSGIDTHRSSGFVRLS
jgi:hypothetical protein